MMRHVLSGLSRADVKRGVPSASVPSRSTTLSGLPLSVHSLPLAFIVGLLLIGLYCWMHWRLQREVRLVHLDGLYLTANVGRIMQLDEVLTMSARLAAATGDLAYETRYHQFEPELHQLIRETLTIFPRARENEAVRRANVVNQRLIDLERRSFQLTHEGRTAEALTLLTSAAYKKEKQTYVDGLRGVFQALQAILRAEEARVRTHHAVSLLVGAIGMAVVFFGWACALRMS